MSAKKKFEMHAEVCKAMAHPLRIEIIDLLQKGELCFSEILEETGGIKSNLSQHLSIMVDNGILVSRKNSRCNYFRLSSSKVSRASKLLCDIMIDTVNKRKAILKEAEA